MFRKLFPGCLVLLLCCGSFGYASTPRPHLRIGETLCYKVYAKTAIYGANQIVKLVSKETMNGREVYRVHAEMTTIGIVKALYHYTQIEDLIMDAEEFYPLWIKLNTQNRSKNQKEEIRFNYAAQKATRVIDKDGEITTEEIPLPGFVQDGLSLIFYLRQNDIREEPHKIYFYGDGSIDDSIFQIKQVSQPIQFESGTYAKYLQISDNVNAVTVLIAENKERLPISIKKIAKFGSIEMRLSKIN